MVFLEAKLLLEFPLPLIMEVGEVIPGFFWI